MQPPATSPSASAAGGEPGADIAETLARAAARLVAPPGQQRPYAGDVTPAEAWQLMSRPGVRFIDVRTPEEHRYVGHVPGSTLVVWRGPDDEQVARFVDELRAQAGPDDVVLLLCRSGVRSVRAATAATRHGFRHACNILEGFEGKIDANGQRGHIDGWRRAGLPWKQD
jgi:rhodanese-related sulfurtransferase